MRNGNTATANLTVSHTHDPQGFVRTSQHSAECFDLTARFNISIRILAALTGIAFSDTLPAAWWVPHQAG